MKQKEIFCGSIKDILVSNNVQRLALKFAMFPLHIPADGKMLWTLPQNIFMLILISNIWLDSLIGRAVDLRFI